jgi:hypothetical protein
MVALAEEHGRLRRERAALLEAQQKHQELMAAAAAAAAAGGGGRGGRGGRKPLVKWVARLERRAVRDARRGSDGEEWE